MCLHLALTLVEPSSLPSLHALTAIKDNNSVPWTIVGVLTLLTLLPAIVLSITPMVRLLVVFHFLRQALGTQTAPSNQTLMGLGRTMTWFLMQPVMVAVNQQAIQPFQQGQISGWQAARARRPTAQTIHAALRAGKGPGAFRQRRLGAAPQDADGPSGRQ